MRVDVIVTEKKSVSSSIARAILGPENFDSYGNSRFLHSDIIEVGELQAPSRPHPNSPYDEERHYFYKPSHPFFAFRSLHNDSQGFQSARRTRRRVDRQRKNTQAQITRPVLQELFDPLSEQELLSRLNAGGYRSIDDLDVLVAQTIDEFSQGTNPLIRLTARGYETTSAGKKLLSERLRPSVTEDISYFVFGSDPAIIILDTQGNPLRSSIRGNPHRVMIDSSSWNDYVSQAMLSPKFSPKGRHPSSSVARMLLFEHVLGHRRLPCDYAQHRVGDGFELNRVLAATDEDVAGSYIFASVLHHVQQQTKNSIPERSIFRLPLETMKPDDVKKGLENPRSMDWNNVVAGKAREYFDMMCGLTHTRSANRLREPGAPRVSIGRTVYLAAKSIALAQDDIAAQPQKQGVYLVFEGLQGKDGVDALIRQRRFAAFSLEERLTAVSPARFLRDVAQRKVGTHTTRYTQLSRLGSLGLIKLRDGGLSLTPRGEAYLQAYGGIADDPSFPLEQWNMVLTDAMDAWRKSPSLDRLVADEQLKRFMQAAHVMFKSHLEGVSSQMFYDASRMLKQAPFEAYLLPRVKVVDDYDDLTAIAENLDEIMVTDPQDPDRGKPLEGITPIITREVPQPMVDYVSIIRRVLHLDPCCEFIVQDPTYNLELLLGLKNGYATIFYAADADIRSLLQSTMRKSSWQPVELDLPEPSPDAHEPLGLTGVRMRDVKGVEGLRLMQEYHLPWVHTHKAIDIVQNGDMNVASFKLNGTAMVRHELYELGKVHNFETLLAMMNTKWGVSFHRTAQLAEELYLNG